MVVEDEQHRGTVQPAGERRVRGESRGVMGEAGKDILRDFLGEPRIAHPPQRSAIHEPGVAPEQRAKRSFVAALGPCGKEMLVGEFTHSSLSPDTAGRGANRTDYFPHRKRSAMFLGSERRPL